MIPIVCRICEKVLYGETVTAAISARQSHMEEYHVNGRIESDTSGENSRA